MKLYKYKAKVLKVVDADTADLLIDVGFNIHIKERVRFFGIDTPESRTRNLKEKKLGLAAKEYVVNKIYSDDVMVSTEEKGKFGRYLAVIYYEKGGRWINLNKELIRKGHAREYFGGKKKGWVQ